eukprot:gene48761-65389_t
MEFTTSLELQSQTTDTRLFETAAYQTLSQCEPSYG